MEILDLIKSRKSIRKFAEKPVEREKIEQIMLAAQLAPSWRNSQCWKFIIVDDPDKKQALIRCTGAFNQAWLGKEYAIIVACADPEKSGNGNNQPYYLVDVAIAMEHLILTATALGLGTCWVGSFDEEKIKSLLGIPENCRVVALTPLGYPAKKEGMVGKIARQVVKSKKRKPISEVYSFNQWD